MEKFNWENPEIFKINKEDGHAIMMPFDSEKDALWDSARKIGRASCRERV